MGVSPNWGSLTWGLGVPIIRIMVFWGLYWGPPILGNYHRGIMEKENPTGLCRFIKGSWKRKWNLLDYRDHIGII